MPQAPSGKGFELPPNNDNRTCVTLTMPDDQITISNFIGAMMALANWFNYRRDAAHSGIIAARMWSEIIQAIEFSKCQIEVTRKGTGCGDDCMSCCIRFNEDGILECFSCGEWTAIDGAAEFTAKAFGTSQPGPDGNIEPGDCQQFNFVIQGNQKVLLPVKVDDGYILEISNADGGWWDGNPLDAWECPSGQTYALGECVSAGVTDPGNPVPGLPVGRLIAIVGAAYLDAYNTTIAVPVGTGPTDVYFQMNDSNLTDNQGSIAVSVKVCQNATPTTSYGISYAYGTGPATVEAGQIFSISSAPRSEPYGVTDNIEFTVSPCLKLELISSTGWVSADSGGVNWNVLDCASVAHTAYSPAATPLSAFGNQESTVVGINSKSPFVATFKATAP